MKLMGALCVFLAMIPFGTASFAQDVLELRDGRVVRGQFVGGTANTVRFEPDGGSVGVFTRDEVLVLTFGASAAPAPAAPPPPPVAAAPAPVQNQAPQRPSQISLPAGTILLVSVDSTLSTDRSRRGERFTTTLVHDVVSNGVVMIPAGTRIFGSVREASSAGRVAGRPELRLRLNQIDINGQLAQISTGSFSEAGRSSFAGTARNAGLGAGVGAAFGGGEGAARGAAIGGATSILTRGDSITIPAGTLLEFRLTNAMVHPAN